MSRGRYEHYGQHEANRIATLKKQGLTWEVISKRFGIAVATCKQLAGRAR